ncbi:GyrI-like domain-containing protein [Acidaminobacter sp. JC074]|uniref:GyrI-like domain-containing protein n=1 Tax=Acidaminobacter sp. JC074 TaxID=2530199 RepID=UPI001F0EA7E8|nr:GyrI-like domain-containing protein [Acidaminobacter sp. JC074]MCH4889496.1 GyrI-like domain-containing protein [Acidaminobacter sp. JC074]
MCRLVELKEDTVVSIRTRAAVEDLPKVIGDCYGKIMAYLSSQGRYPSGVPFIGYYNMDMSDLDVEIGFPIMGKVDQHEDIQMSVIPGGSYAEYVHTGPYPTLREGYEVLMKWLEKEGLKVSGTCYEFYLNDPGEVKEEDLQTRILFKI